MRVYGDLFEIQRHFLSMLDCNIQYTDVYVVYITNEKGEYDVDFGKGKKAWFIDENCKAWEVIDQLESIMMWTGADVSFWEHEDCPYCKEEMDEVDGFYICRYCPDGKNNWTRAELEYWRQGN